MKYVFMPKSVLPLLLMEGGKKMLFVSNYLLFCWNSKPKLIWSQYKQYFFSLLQFSGQPGTQNLVSIQRD